MDQRKESVMKKVNEMMQEEQEKLLEIVKEDMKRTLSEKRYLHSISTMEKARELALEYNQDATVTMLTALAHDIAKEMSKEEQYEYAKQNNIELDEFDKLQTTMIHGKIGAHITAEKYGFTKEMQDAIVYHTTGRAGMTTLDKIVFLADKAENMRIGEEADTLRKVIKEKGLDAAILWNTDNHALPWLIEKQKMIHPNCIFARNEIIANMHVNEK